MADEDKRRRTVYLNRIDGLTDDERTRRFSNIDDHYEPGVLINIREATVASRGMITLVGDYGTGKSTLLICAVNEARELGRVAVYTTLTDLLAYLRRTFEPGAEDTFDQYWEALLSCDVLALDELDEPKSTDWALEKFQRLMDERWRRMEDQFTICAINSRINSLPGKIQSRLRDGRAQIISIGGLDMRPGNTWERN